MTYRDVGVFDRDAAAYHRARPDYPAEQIDFAVAGLPAGARALEIGCGTGIATLPVLERGLEVVAVERGPQLIAYVRERTQGKPIEFVCARFEDYEPEPGGFDLVYSAQAWHWLEPEGRNEKVARALRPDGRLAVIQRMVHGNWLAGDDLYRKYWPREDAGDGADLPSVAERLERMRAGIEEAGVLEVTDVRRVRMDRTHTAQEYVDLLATFSDHGALPPDVQAPFFAAVKARIEELGGTIVRPADIAVIRARRANG